jgi:hypothetical protein
MSRPGTWPDMAILDIQRRGQQIGRIRIGEQVAILKDGKDTGRTRPARRETFRLTTGSRHEADAIAALLGGTPRPWNGQWEVPTDATEINVMVPPRDQVISQNYEMWTAGGCQRRCDSQHEQVSGGPCLCPHAADPSDAEEVERAALRRAEMAKMNPPRACGLVTRLNVMIPDLPGLGVFRLDTGSYYAAVEIGDAAALLQAARDRGLFLPAVLRIDHRQRVAGGQTKKFPVPVLEILATFRQIAGGELEAAGIAAQLPPAPGAGRAAITAGAAAGERVITGKALPPGAMPPADDGYWPAEEPEEPADGVLAEDEADWLAADLEAAKAFTTNEAGAALWRAAAGRYRAGVYGKDDATRVQDAIRARRACLAAEAASKGTLPPEDPWAVKVAGLGDEHEAACALTELAGLAATGAVDAGKASLIRAAILERFSGAEAA